DVLAEHRPHVGRPTPAAADDHNVQFLAGRPAGHDVRHPQQGRPGESRPLNELPAVDRGRVHALHGYLRGWRRQVGIEGAAILPQQKGGDNRGNSSSTVRCLPPLGRTVRSLARCPTCSDSSNPITPEDPATWRGPGVKSPGGYGT